MQVCVCGGGHGTCLVAVQVCAFGLPGQERGEHKGQAAEQSPDAVGGCLETSGLPCLLPSAHSCCVCTHLLLLLEQGSQGGF